MALYQKIQIPKSQFHFVQQDWILMFWYLNDVLEIGTLSNEENWQMSE